MTVGFDADPPTTASLASTAVAVWDPL